MIHWLIAIACILLAWTYLKPKKAKRLPVATEAEAREILGVTEGADADAIHAAHRRLAAQVHPDRGGSVDLARRVNAARDLLLKGR
ncbi:DnaJ domain-containing protein [Sphingomonas oligophenolica]|uniref:DnaJ domain-containing protein n=1 Tax=Sphingomonas oligophenolica TaxID=301154 RepID=UPI0018839826|nr:DnaJ domain-containing protein [Sphingomonas oligophenolica]